VFLNQSKGATPNRTVALEILEGQIRYQTFENPGGGAEGPNMWMDGEEKKDKNT